MSSALTRPDFKADIADLRRRLDRLERRLTPTWAALTHTHPGDIPFSYAGDLESGTESPPIKVRYRGTIHSVAVALGTAGSTSTIIDVEKNGTVVGTVTITGGASDEVAEIGEPVDPEDRISLVVDTAGTGAADMTAVVRFA